MSGEMLKPRGRIKACQVGYEIMFLEDAPERTNSTRQQFRPGFLSQWFGALKCRTFR